MVRGTSYPTCAPCALKGHVAVMSAGLRFREDGDSRDFRDMVRRAGGSISNLPDGTFREAGTNVQTVLVHIQKGRLP